MIKKLILLDFTMILSMFLFFYLFNWYNAPAYATAPRFKPLSKEVKCAMMKCGPYYHYKLYPDGKLMVLINGKWLNLKY